LTDTLSPSFGGEAVLPDDPLASAYLVAHRTGFDMGRFLIAKPRGGDLPIREGKP